MNSRCIRILLGGVFLRDEKNQPVSRKRFFDGANRHVATDKKRQHHVGIDNDVANR